MHTVAKYPRNATEFRENNFLYIRNVLYSGNVWQGKFGKFGESSMIYQTNLVFYNY